MAKRQFEVDILAPSFIKKEGLATQYLKADGSVDFGQRIVEDVNIGDRNFESDDRFKTLISGTNPRLNLLGNIFQINDEVEIYGRSRIQIIETDTYLTINYLGIIYDINNPDIDIPTNAKAWLKCVDLGIFILSISEPNSGGTSYTDEQAQDAVGTIVTDTTFINLDYNDATPTITASLSATGTTGTGRKYLRDDNTWAELDDNSYIQRPVKFITTATYNFIATDDVKTLIVETTDARTNIYLNQNIFLSGDEIEVYDKSNSHKTYIYPGVNVSIFHQGTNYLFGTSFSLGSYQKIWLKCTGVNKFDVVFINSDTEIGGGAITKEVEVDFGVIESQNKTFTILDTQVTATSKIAATISGNPTTDHSTDEVMILDLKAYANNIVAGVGFDIIVISQNNLKGKFNINYTL